MTANAFNSCLQNIYRIIGYYLKTKSGSILELRPSRNDAQSVISNIQPTTKNEKKTLLVVF